MSLRIASIAVAAIALFGCHRVSPARSPFASMGDSLPLARRLALVERMDRHVRDNFAHWDGMGGRNYDSLASAFRAAATDSRTRIDFDLAALMFTGGLQNGHSRFSDRWLQQTNGQTLWLYGRRTSEGWLVTGSDYPDIARGALIRTINHEPFDAFYERQKGFLAESDERTRPNSLFFSDFLWPLRMTLGLDDGRRVQIVRGEPADSIVLARRPVQAHVPHRWQVADSIGYVRVRRFTPRSYEDSALAIIQREYLRAPALIIDVRGNGGGSSPSRLISLLMGDLAWRSMPVVSSRISSDIIGTPREVRASSGTVYRGAVVVLTDIGCGSACEDFVAPFFDNRRALVVGDTTWGSTGQPRSIDLGDGMAFQVSARRYTRQDGSRFEGSGIPVNVRVPLTAADLRAGRDAALDTAIARLRGIIAR
jgi:carboxyl-terminal processing protease